MRFNNIEFKPLIHKGMEIPDYYVSKCGKILSNKRTKGRGTPKMLDHTRKQLVEERGVKGTYARPLAVNLSVPIGFFKEYDYVASTNGAGQVSSKHSKVNIRYHRAVKETWEPIDEHPPVPKADWDKSPESMKQFVRESAYVDHIDADTSNNHIDNLSWTSPLGNSSQRKKNGNG